MKEANRAYLWITTDLLKINKHDFTFKVKTQNLGSLGLIKTCHRTEISNRVAFIIKSQIWHIQISGAIL